MLARTYAYPLPCSYARTRKGRLAAANEQCVTQKHGDESFVFYEEGAPAARRSALLSSSPTLIPASQTSTGKNVDDRVSSDNVLLAPVQRPAPPERGMPCRPMLRNNNSDLAKQLQVLLWIGNVC